MTDTPPRIKLRLEYDSLLILGPGKAQLLDLIAQTGSISAAARGMGMSYKRAWSLIEELNAACRAPAVSSTRGGPGGGGASVTPAGQQLLRHFRALEALLEREGASELEALSHLLRGKPI